MDLSLRWLGDYVDTGVTPKQFCDAMTMSGSKVECYSEEADYITNCVVGRIINIEKVYNSMMDVLNFSGVDDKYVRFGLAS